MTIDSVKMQEPMIDEKPQMSVQNGIQKEMLKETTTGTGANSVQKQTAQLLATSQPLAQIQQTAQSQISKGYLDIKV